MPTQPTQPRKELSPNEKQNRDGSREFSDDPPNPKTPIPEEYPDVNKGPYTKKSFTPKKEDKKTQPQKNTKH